MKKFIAVFLMATSLSFGSVKSFSKKTGHDVKCLVSFGQAKSCKKAKQVKKVAPVPKAVTK
jgi:hypothetical protein